MKNKLNKKLIDKLSKGTGIWQKNGDKLWDNPIVLKNKKNESEILKLQQEISTWEFLASGLTQDNQQNIKTEIIMTIKSFKQHLKEIEND